jgi:ribose-phosphate pyrophosphokinase
VWIASTDRYAPLATAIAQAMATPLVAVERRTFPDGEHYHRLPNGLAGADVALVGGTATDADTLELFDLACGLVHEQVRGLVVVIPYFGYSTMERAVRRGEIVKASTRARLLSAIPAPRGRFEFVFLDLHSEGIPYYLATAAACTHLYAKPLVVDVARRLGGADFVLAATDAGRAKWVESLANDLEVESAFVYKRRSSGSHTALTGVNADVSGRVVVIYDDMIRTGGSLIQAARAYRERGASQLYAVATHLVLPAGAKARLQDSGLFERVVGTDSLPQAREQADDFLEVVSVADLLADYLRGRLLW